ncbi:MAG: Flp pilus assembly complex ATPase component TadA [Chloroflexi bacterium]|nr:Flp pilus assembly complex ATPase component TadA [Chloroflexota bacterium]
MVGPIGVGQRKRIGESLLEGAFISQEQLEAALELSRRMGKKVGEALVEQGAVSPETLASFLSFQLNVPIIDLKQFKIQPEALLALPEEVARQYNVIPLSIDGETLTVAMEDPQDIAVIDTLTSLTRKAIKPVISLHGGIRETIDRHYKLTAKIQRQVSEAVSTATPRAVPETMTTPSAIAQAPVVKVTEMLVEQAIKDRASDIHIEPQEDGIRIRYRIDGILHPMVTLPMGAHSALISRIKVLANMNIAERRRSQDGQFTMTVAGKQVDFRVATAETSHGEMVVMRVLDKSVSVLQLSDLGFQPEPMRVYERMLQSPFGMIMISGPTGSGKTTTLYASVNMLDASSRNIMTIEDPIEYRFKNINQIQVNRAADITFASGLRAIMRLDPDVILVGEIRDEETANTAVQAALTGHLVLTSIHANDAVGAMIRLIDLGVEPFLVTSAVVGAIGQRLVRKVCPYCRGILHAPPEEAMAYQQEMQEVRTDFYYGRGCNFCSRTGYLTRVGVYEILPMSEPVRALITRQAPATEIKAQALREGMITMRRDGMLKSRDGITTPYEVIRNVFTIG